MVALFTLFIIRQELQKAIKCMRINKNICCFHTLPTHVRRAITHNNILLEFAWNKPFWSAVVGHGGHAPLNLITYFFWGAFHQRSPGPTMAHKPFGRDRLLEGKPATLQIHQPLIVLHRLHTNQTREVSKTT